MHHYESVPCKKTDLLFSRSQVRNLNYKLCFLYSCPLLFKHCMVATCIRKIMHSMIYMIQNSLHLLTHCLWYNSSIPLKSYFMSILLPILFVQPQILGFFLSQGCAGLLGTDPFSISDLSSGTLFLSL